MCQDLKKRYHGPNKESETRTFLADTSICKGTEATPKKPVTRTMTSSGLEIRVHGGESGVDGSETDLRSTACDPKY